MLKTKFIALAVGLALVVVLTRVDHPRAVAQQGDIFSRMVGRPNAMPELPPEGAWGEVINATDRWLVVQNHAGQQFPIALADINQFLIRWPYSLDSLGAQSLVETYGRDMGSNTIESAHIDVYEGEDRGLVAPTYSRVLPQNANLPTVNPVTTSIYNSIMNSWGYPGQLTLYGWAYPVAPNGAAQVPIRVHVVGAPIDRNPLRVALPGNNGAGIVPGRNVQFSVTQVTRGSMRLVRKGDFAFMTPIGIKPSGIVLSQLLIYKNIPLVRFNPAR